jgi:hypothetical protein
MGLKMSFWTFPDGLLCLIVSCVILIGVGTLFERFGVLRMDDVRYVAVFSNLLFLAFALLLCRGIGNSLWVFIAIVLVASSLIPFGSMMKMCFVEKVALTRIAMFFLSVTEFGVILAFSVVYYLFYCGFVKTDNQSMVLALLMMNLLVSGVVMTIGGLVACLCQTRSLKNY